MLRAPFLLVTALLLIGTVGAAVEKQVRSNSAADEVTPVPPDTLLQLEADFMKAAAEHGRDGYMSY